MSNEEAIEDFPGPESYENFGHGSLLDEIEAELAEDNKSVQDPGGLIAKNVMRSLVGHCLTEVYGPQVDRSDQFWKDLGGMLNTHTLREYRETSQAFWGGDVDLRALPLPVEVMFRTQRMLEKAPIKADLSSRVQRRLLEKSLGIANCLWATASMHRWSKMLGDPGSYADSNLTELEVEALQEVIDTRARENVLVSPHLGLGIAQFDYGLMLFFLALPLQIVRDKAMDSYKKVTDQVRATFISGLEDERPRVQRWLAVAERDHEAFIRCIEALASGGNTRGNRQIGARLPVHEQLDGAFVPQYGKIPCNLGLYATFLHEFMGAVTCL